MLLAAGVLFGVGISLAVPAGAALVSDSIVSNRQGMGMGAFQTFIQLGSSLGVSVMAFVAQDMGFGSMFEVSAVISVAISISLFATISNKRREIRPKLTE